MSTRCQIATYETENPAAPKDFEALIYRHSDGYPTGQHGALHDILKVIAKPNIRKRQSEYCSAWVLFGMMEEQVKSNKKYYKEDKKTSRPPYYPADGYSGIGFGICKEFHGDIEYFYVITPTETRTYSVKNIWDKLELTWDDFELLRTDKHVDAAKACKKLASE